MSSFHKVLANQAQDEEFKKSTEESFKQMQFMMANMMQVCLIERKKYIIEIRKKIERK